MQVVVSLFLRRIFLNTFTLSYRGPESQGVTHIFGNLFPINMRDKMIVHQIQQDLICIYWLLVVFFQIFEISR